MMLYVPQKCKIAVSDPCPKKRGDIPECQSLRQRKVVDIAANLTDAHNSLDLGITNQTLLSTGPYILGDKVLGVKSLATEEETKSWRVELPSRNS